MSPRPRLPSSSELRALNLSAEDLRARLSTLEEETIGGLLLGLVDAATIARDADAMMSTWIGLLLARGKTIAAPVSDAELWDARHEELGRYVIAGCVGVVCVFGRA